MVEAYMSGRFEGLSDLEWKLFEDVMPEKRKRVGRRDTPMRYVLNSMLYILITCCRWCDLPRGKQWASKSTSHRKIIDFHKDGTLERIKARILGIADERGLIGWEYGAIDGSFSPWTRRR
jgi:transposase